MACVHIYQLYIETVDYSDVFHFHIEFESVKHGLQCSIIQTDGEKEIHIGGILSKGYDIEESMEFAMDLINNKNYCLGIWNKHCNTKANKKHNAFH